MYLWQVSSQIYIFLKIDQFVFFFVFILCDVVPAGSVPMTIPEDVTDVLVSGRFVSSYLYYTWYIDVREFVLSFQELVTLEESLNNFAE